jgi:hypothetical protein
MERDKERNETEGGRCYTYQLQGKNNMNSNQYGHIIAACNVIEDKKQKQSFCSFITFD